MIFFSCVQVLLDLHCLPVGVYDADVDDDNNMYYQYSGVSLGNYWVLYHISVEAPACVREITGADIFGGVVHTHISVQLLIIWRALFIVKGYT